MNENSATAPPPKSPATRILTASVALIAVGALLYFSFRTVDWHDFAARLRAADPALLALYLPFPALSIFLRSRRWRVLLQAETEVPALTVFWATTTGYLFNFLMPGRLGELIRSAAIGSAARVSNAFVLATTLCERILDAAFLVIVLALALTTTPDLPAWLHRGAFMMLAAALIGLIVMLILPRQEQLVVRLLQRLPLPDNLRLRLVDLTSQFLLGLRAFQHGGRLFRFAAYAVVIWCLDICGAVILGRAVGCPVTFALGAVVIASTALSSAIPATPGAVGVYQVVSVAVLTPFGIQKESALAFAVLLQAGTFFIVISFGLIGLWNLRSVVRQVRRATPAEPLVSRGTA